MVFGELMGEGMAYAGGGTCDYGPGFLTVFAELFDLVLSLCSM